MSQVLRAQVLSEQASRIGLSQRRDDIDARSRREAHAGDGQIDDSGPVASEGLFRHTIREESDLRHPAHTSNRRSRLNSAPAPVMGTTRPSSPLKIGASPDKQ